MVARGLVGLVAVAVGAVRQRNQVPDPAGWPNTLVLAVTPSALKVYSASQLEYAQEQVASMPWSELGNPGIERKPMTVVLTFTREDGREMTLKTKSLGMNHDNPKVAEAIASRITAAGR
jgi:hypothetical protein